jgi:hypothetical protein
MNRVYYFVSGLLIVTFLYSCRDNKKETVTKEPIYNSQKIPIVEKMKAQENFSLDEKIELYKKLKRDSTNKYNFENETELTMYGYSYLWNNEVADAIKVFQLINSEFGSSNSFDNLGEAYQLLGDTTLSIVNYQKSVEIDPNNFNAEDQIEKMRYPDKPQEKLSDKFDKVYTVEEYKNDLDQLGNKLLTIHPNSTKFISKANLLQLIENKKALITPQTTGGEFIWHCDEIIASINCSHTSFGSFSLEGNMLPYVMGFPIEVRLINNHLFVIKTKNNADRINIKDEIVSINGVSVSDIISDSYKHLPSQGNIITSKNNIFNVWAAAIIPYALDFPETFTVQVKGKSEPISLRKSETYTDVVMDPTIKNCDNNLCLELVNKNTAILSISSFYYYRHDILPVFTKFIDSSMQVINEKKIENLLVDVRANGGGAPEASIYLLRYLMDKPFTYFSKAEYKGKTEKTIEELPVVPFENRFKGNKYFLIDGYGNSTTGHFMSLVKLHGLGPIVGEELGSNQFCSGGMIQTRLSNTKLKFWIATNTHETTAISLPDEVGILPDHFISQSIDDYIQQKDVVKEFTLNLIK